MLATNGANTALGYVIAVPCGVVTLIGFWLSRRLGVLPSIATLVSAVAMAGVLLIMGFPVAAVCVATASGLGAVKSWRFLRADAR